ncbi:MAG: GntR family transcriptional regulator [Coriobacteriales bacterium]|jgi:GntR family transcriptional regulator|nr:GntR family transcriptional regulator [Coriobacteriales bacterium]
MEESFVFEPLQINESSGIPVWVQIRNWLFFLIKTEQYRAGDVLPTVRELATTLGVNYNTVHKVYQDLETEGLICSSKGKRSFVAQVDTRFLQLPDSPVDVIIEELVRVARDENIDLEEVQVRTQQRFASYEEQGG